MAGRELEELLVADAEELRDWLARHHEDSPGVWLVLGRKGGSATSLTWQQAVDEALCVGWIDGQARKRDEESYAIRYLPRGPRSTWSRRNVEHVARLEAEGRMRPAGRAAVEAARADGRWDAAYAPPSETVLPEDFLDAVRAVPSAQAMLEVLTKANTFAIATRLAGVKKAETRARWVTTYVEMLARHETPVPQKRGPDGPAPA